MAKSAPKLAVFISGHGSNLQSIIDQIDAATLNAQIVCVISDQEDAYGLTRAKKHGIPAHAIAVSKCPSKCPSKCEFETEVLSTLKPYQPQLLILAGFMKILSADFVLQYQNKILNIHPSLLPKYKGLNTHSRVLAAGDNKHGATVHLVTPKLDSGTIIIQQSFDVQPEDDEMALQTKTHKIEHVIYPIAIQQYANKIALY